MTRATDKQILEALEAGKKYKWICKHLNTYCNRIHNIKHGIKGTRFAAKDRKKPSKKRQDHEFVMGAF